MQEPPQGVLIVLQLIGLLPLDQFSLSWAEERSPAPVPTLPCGEALLGLFSSMKYF